MSPAQQLEQIRARVLPLILEQTRYWHEEIVPALNAADVRILDYAQLQAGDCDVLHDYFKNEIFPVLTPLAVDPGRPFPHISNLSLNLAVTVRSPRGEKRFARIKVPTSLPRLVPLEAGRRFVWLEDVISGNLGTLFPGFDVMEAYAFRITRDTDMEIQEDEASDLLETIEQSLRQRHFGPAVRLEVDADMPEHLIRLLADNLEVAAEDVYPLQRPLGMSSLIALMELNRPDLKDVPFVPAVPPQAARPEDGR